MSVTFFIALVVALLAIVYWRIVLMIVAAILIAMIATGIITVSGAVAGLHEHQTIVAPGAPGAPGAQAGEPQSDPGDTSNGSEETDPRAQGQSPG
jgi:hypothetical protein